jgi:hypothetical protein
LAAANLPVLSNEFLVMPGVMSSSRAGSCTLKGYFATLVVCFISLLGKTNCLLEARPLRQHVLSAVPTPEVQAQPATVEGIETSFMPLRRRSLFTPRTYCRGMGRMMVALATVSSSCEVAAQLSHCLLIQCVHHWVILLAISGGIFGWGTTGESPGVYSLTWHGSGDRQV